MRGAGSVNWKWIWVFWIVNGFEITVGYTMTRGGTRRLTWSWRDTVASIRGQRPKRTLAAESHLFSFLSRKLDTHNQVVNAAKDGTRITRC